MDQRSKSLKLHEKNIEETLQCLGIGKDILQRIPEAQAIFCLYNKTR